MTVQEGATALDTLVNKMMTENEEEPYEFDEDELAEGLKCEIDVTKDFFQLLMHDYESTEPKKENLVYLYFKTQTMGFVMFDRLVEMAKQVDNLVNVIIHKQKSK